MDATHAQQLTGSIKKPRPIWGFLNIVTLDSIGPSCVCSMHLVSLQDLFKLHLLPPESQLWVHLQAGLSALKTHSAYAAGASK